MAEGDKKTFSWKSLLIQILVALLITGGLVATVGKTIKDWYIDHFVTYYCNINLSNGQSINLTGIMVKLNGDSLKTDDKGKVIFKVKRNKYACAFIYSNTPHLRYYTIDKDTTLDFDISTTLVNPSTGKAVKLALAQPSKDTTKKLVKATDAVKIVPANEISLPPTTAQQKSVPVDTPRKIQPTVPLTANEILQHLQLRVKIDSGDSYRGKGKQFAYHYYLKGSKDLMDKIVMVLYQRNDPTFIEFQNHEYNQGDNKNKNFEYIGYQWGSVFTTYIQIILDNGAKSDIYLKQIIYDN
jgi:hypothetical protein